MKRLLSDNVTSWVDVRFVYRGFNRCGCDCVGLIVGIFVECEIHADFLQYYFSHRAGNAKYVSSLMIESVLKESFFSVGINDVKCGDLLAFAINRGSVNHLGVVSKINPVYFVHAHRGVGRVVENILDHSWERFLIGAFRYAY